MKQDISDIWKEVLSHSPLIYHLTNSVASHFSANVTLAVGASPIMSLHPEEASEFASMADGIVVNTGTPSEQVLSAMKVALSTAVSSRTPVLLDPVGYGSSKLRTDIIHSFLNDYRITVLKGNGGEISLLGGASAKVRGVDTIYSSDLHNCVLSLAQRYSSIVVATGMIDIVSDGNIVLEIHGGDPLLGRITASGCIAGSIICCCLASSANVLWSTVAALVAIGIASERAAGKYPGPGSFPPGFIDELSRLTPGDFMNVGNRIISMEVE